MVKRTKMLIVGSGGNGISLAVLLDRAGHSDFTIITKHRDFGGAWFQNTYPGCEVDCASSVYQFGFRPNPDWSALFVGQPELMDYMQRVAAENRLYERTLFGCEMTGARWNEATACWQVETTAGRIEAEHLMLATGFLEEAVIPDLPGLDTFAGPAFHSSQWPEGFSGEGQRVAVIGSGSSAIQIVPALQERAAHVWQFQRTPTWLLPKNNRLLTEAERQALAASPEEMERRRAEVFEQEETLWQDTFVSMNGAEYEHLARIHLENQIADPELRRLLTPGHAMGCKRPLVSDNYYTSLTQDNVTLVPEGVAGIRDGSLVTGGGKSFEVDAIVFATGFYFGGHILNLVERRDGQTVGVWQAGHPRAYKSVSVAGCPNLYLVGGPAPNGQIWNGLYPGEAVATYVLRILEHLREKGLRAIEVREEAELEWKRAADALLDKAPVVAGGCTNYSLDDTGHNKAAWPGTLRSMTAALSEFDASKYDPV